tara:strand:+ start:3283 stop:3450 length:168 start_codon:yes stop_codon:yes gene_type:complete
MFESIMSPEAWKAIIGAKCARGDGEAGIAVFAVFGGAEGKPPKREGFRIASGAIR